MTPATTIDSFADVIRHWPSAAALARELGVEAVTVRAWRKRGIPARYWTALARLAAERGSPIDERTLAQLASPKRLRGAEA